MKLRVALPDLKGNGRNVLRGRRLPFKLGVIATLAIAVGANIAVLGNLGVLFRPVVPGATHQRFLEPWLLTARDAKTIPTETMGVSRWVYSALADELKGRAQVALYQPKIESARFNGGIPRDLAYLYATPSLASVLGAHVIAGRMLAAADSLPDAAPVMLISANLARRQFGGAQAALGKMIEVKGKSREVVGVLPAKLVFPSGALNLGTVPEAWLPFGPEATAALSIFKVNLHAIVYAPSGISRAALRSTLVVAQQQAFQRQSADLQHMLKERDLQPRVGTLAEREFGPQLARLHLLEVAAAVLLLLVFANLGGLTTANALARRHELATRRVLGAGLGRLYWERARELLVLGLIGWVFGIGLGWLGSRALAASVGRAGLPAVFSAPVLLITLAAVVVITLLLALGGLRRLRASTALFGDVASGGRVAGARGSLRLLRALVVFQIVASLVLLALSAHVQMNVLELMHGELGFNPQQRTFFKVAIPGSLSDRDYPKRLYAFDRAFIARLGTLPGVKAAAGIMEAPFRAYSGSADVRTAPGTRTPGHEVGLQTVSSDAVAALGLQVIAGSPAQMFKPASRAVILDRAAAQRLWPDTPIPRIVGRDFYVNGEVRSVAAIVGTLRMQPYASVGGTVFMPFFGRALPGVIGAQSFVVHSPLAASVLRSELTDAARHINPQAKLVAFHSADALIREAYAARNHLAHVSGLLALVTLTIATAGLFALLAYRAVLRRPEFAIRGALGATPARLFMSVLAEAAALWASGCVIGLPLAWVFSSVLAAQLPELHSIEPWLAAVVAVGLGTVVMIAALIPALRSGRTTPAAVLHQP